MANSCDNTVKTIWDETGSRLHDRWYDHDTLNLRIK